MKGVRTGMSRAAAVKHVVARSGGCCEVGVPGVCLGRHHSTHHRRKPGRVWTPANLLAVCGDGTTGCHGWIEAHPKLARAHGWWLFTGDGAPDAVPLRMHANAMSRWYLFAEDGGLIPTPAPPGAPANLEAPPHVALRPAAPGT